jgi:hypothetical protein
MTGRTDSGGVWLLKLAGSTGVSDITAENNVRIYPNPAKGTVGISFNQYIDKATIKLYDLMGQMVMAENNLSGSKMSIDISKLASGNYVIEISCEGNVLRRRLVKE